MKILSLDGGGIRGVLTARILWRLERACPGFLNSVDLIAGTSTGGILALAIARGLTTEALVDLYAKRGNEIFSDRDVVDHMPKEIRFTFFALGMVLAGVFAGLGHTYIAAGLLAAVVALWTISFIVGKTDELFRANFSPEHIEKVFRDVYGENTTLRDLKKRVLIPSFDMREWSPKFFDNLPGNERDLDMKLVDVARCTSAAPSYWPSHLWCLDGGLFANNPSDSAVAAAVRHMRTDMLTDRPEMSEREATVRALSEITVLSIGTGEVPHQPPSENPQWDAGLFGALKVVLDVVMDGAVKASAFRTTQAINGSHVRINPKLPAVVDLADIGQVQHLIEIADMADLESAIALIRTKWLAHA